MKIIKRTQLDIFAGKILSALFNPFLIFFLVIFFANSFNIKNNSFSDLNLPHSFFITIVAILPSFAVYLRMLFKHKKEFAEYVSVPRESREKIYIVAFLSFVFVTISFASFHERYWMLLSMCIVVLLGMLFLANTFIDKASMHSAVFAFCVVYLTQKSSVGFSLLFAFLPLIYWARIVLHKHDWLQLLLGSIIGLSVGLITWSF